MKSYFQISKFQIHIQKSNSRLQSMIIDSKLRSLWRVIYWRNYFKVIKNSLAFHFFILKFDPRFYFFYAGKKREGERETSHFEKEINIKSYKEEKISTMKDYYIDEEGNSWKWWNLGMWTIMISQNLDQIMFIIKRYY